MRAESRMAILAERDRAWADVAMHESDAMAVRDRISEVCHECKGLGFSCRAG